MWLGEMFSSQSVQWSLAALSTALAKSLAACLWISCVVTSLDLLHTVHGSITLRPVFLRSRPHTDHICRPSPSTHPDASPTSTIDSTVLDCRGTYNTLKSQAPRPEISPPTIPNYWRTPFTRHRCHSSCSSILTLQLWTPFCLIVNFPIHSTALHLISYLFYFSFPFFNS